MKDIDGREMQVEDYVAWWTRTGLSVGRIVAVNENNTLKIIRTDGRKVNVGPYKMVLMVAAYSDKFMENLTHAEAILNRCAIRFEAQASTMAKYAEEAVRSARVILAGNRLGSRPNE